MKIQVVSDLPALGRQAAAHVAGAARQAVADRGRFTVAFSGGTTPAAMLDALASQSLTSQSPPSQELPSQGLASQGLPWDRIEVFQVDERAAPDGHPDRNLELLRRHLLERVPIPSGNVHPMPAGAPDLAAAVVGYAETLRRVCGRPPVIDLVQLGLGRDGHTASLVPGDPVAEVTDRDIAVTGRYAGRRRLTLTVPALNRARSLLWLVAGEDKAAAVKQLVDGDPGLVAARVAGDRALLLVDAAAAAAIRPVG